MRLGILIVAVLLMTGCDKKQEESKGGIYENGNSSTTTTAPTTTEEAPKEPAPATTIEFLETEHKFGTINEGAMVSHSFKFKNTGTHPLIISSAKADCGCTVPNPPKDPILPGQESQIDVKFNSAGKGGQEVNKTITVIANTEPATSLLHMIGKVKSKDEGSPIKK